MKKTLVLGIGSRVMTDDAIGIELVEDLVYKAPSPDIAYVIGETDVDYCLDEILDFNNIIVIDAYLSGKHPGTVTSVHISELEGIGICDSLYRSAHSLHLLDRLKYKRHSGDVRLIGIEPFDISYGFNLSRLMQKEYNRVFSEVKQQIEDHIEKI